MNDPETKTEATDPKILLAHHLKKLKLPTVLAEYERQARQCAEQGIDHPRYLLRLVELELIERQRKMVERRVRAAKFPASKSLDSFDFTALPSLNKVLVLELARCEFIVRRENIIALGPSGTGKTHLAIGLGLAACQRGMPVGFTTAASLVNQLTEARREAPAPPAIPACQTATADHRRAWLRATLTDGCRAPVRGYLATLRTRLYDYHIEPAVRGLDQRVRFRTPHRRAARSPHPPRPNPGDEWRQLPAEAIQGAQPKPTRLIQEKSAKALWPLREGAIMLRIAVT